MTARLAEEPERFVLPIAPMIGCFGVAPAAGQALSTATSAQNGGNMDYRRFGPGAVAAYSAASWVGRRCSAELRPSVYDGSLRRNATSADMTLASLSPIEGARTRTCDLTSPIDTKHGKDLRGRSHPTAMLHCIVFAMAIMPLPHCSRTRQGVRIELR